MKTSLFAATAALAIFATSAAPAAGAYKTAIFAGGCFWSMEKAFEAEPGVVNAVSGYAGGAMMNPTYEDHRGYQEAVKVTYDPAKVSYAQLVDRLIELAMERHQLERKRGRTLEGDTGPGVSTS